MKAIICDAPVLLAPFRLQVDVSHVVADRVLLQEDAFGFDRPVGFFLKEI